MDRLNDAAASAAPAILNSGLSGRWRPTVGGGQIAILYAEDNLKGALCVTGFASGPTSGKYIKNSAEDKYTQIEFVDTNEDWTIKGDVKGRQGNVIVWNDDTRWDRIG